MLSENTVCIEPLKPFKCMMTLSVCLKRFVTTYSDSGVLDLTDVSKENRAAIVPNPCSLVLCTLQA